jgi:hypothetical protein
MADRDNIADRVAGILIDDNPDAVARIVPEIQKAQSDLETRSYKFLVQEAVISPTPQCTTGSPELCAVPSDWIEPNGDPFFYQIAPFDQIGFVTPPLSWESSIEEMLKIYPPALSPSTYSMPSLLYIEPILGKIYLSPWPDDTYTIWVPYYKRLASLAAGSDSNWWTDNAEDYLAFRAAARVLSFNRDPEYMKYEVMAEAEFKRLKRVDKLARYRKHGSRVRPRRDVHGTMRQRRM